MVAPDDTAAPQGRAATCIAALLSLGWVLSAQPAVSGCTRHDDLDRREGKIAGMRWGMSQLAPCRRRPHLVTLQSSLLSRPLQGVSPSLHTLDDTVCGIDGLQLPAAVHQQARKILTSEGFGVMAVVYCFLICSAVALGTRPAITTPMKVHFKPVEYTHSSWQHLPVSREPPAVLTGTPPLRLSFLLYARGCGFRRNGRRRARGRPPRNGGLRCGCNQMGV